MDPQLDVGVEIKATALPPSSGLTSTVFITLHHIAEEFIQDLSGLLTLIGHKAYQTPSLTINLHSSSCDDIRELLCCRLWDLRLCQRLALRIASVANQMEFGLRGFFMYVHFGERFLLVSGSSSRGAPEVVIQRLVLERTVSIGNLKNRNLESAKCAICLEEFSGSDSLTDMVRSHVFHNQCILEWLKQQKSCPFCWRVPYNEETD